jgi:hypothetical protein
MATGAAQPKVNPGGTRFQTLFTAKCTRRHVTNVSNVLAAFHRLFLHVPGGTVMATTNAPAIVSAAATMKPI